MCIIMCTYIFGLEGHSRPMCKVTHNCNSTAIKGKSLSNTSLHVLHCIPFLLSSTTHPLGVEARFNDCPGSRGMSLNESTCG